jgi:hypothetical protein
MSSTNKTSGLGLNSWIGADTPQREDFNNDNALLDRVISTHTSDIGIHVTSDEKTAWNNPYFIAVYYGDGASSKNVELTCSFEPSWGIVFASSMTPGVIDIKNESHYNYFGIVTDRGSNIGLSLNGKTLKVVESSASVNSYEYRNYNEKGVTYIAIMFR